MERRPRPPQGNVELQPHRSATETRLGPNRINSQPAQVEGPGFKHAHTHTCIHVHTGRDATLHHLMYHQKSAGMRHLCGCICLCGCYVCAAEKINKKVKTSAAAVWDERTQLWIAPELTATPVITLKCCAIKLLEHRNQPHPHPQLKIFAPGLQM